MKNCLRDCARIYRVSSLGFRAEGCKHSTRRVQPSKLVFSAVGLEVTIWDLGVQNSEVHGLRGVSGVV